MAQTRAVCVYGQTFVCDMVDLKQTRVDAASLRYIDGTDALGRVARGSKKTDDESVGGLPCWVYTTTAPGGEIIGPRRWRERVWTV